jgi:hypothetical protein
MWCNSNSYNGHSGVCVASEDRVVRTLPALFRYLIPGFEAGWPAR